MEYSDYPLAILNGITTACRLENAIFEGTGHNLVTEEAKGQAVNGLTP